MLLTLLTPNTTPQPSASRPLSPALGAQVVLRVVVEPQTMHLLHIGTQHDTLILCPPPSPHLWLCRWC